MFTSVWYICCLNYLLSTHTVVIHSCLSCFLVLKFWNVFYFLSSLPLPNVPSLPMLGSRATVFWDHMTISQPRPPPLPMCSSPHGVASPAQSRPALRMPPAVSCPPWGTTSSPTGQVHPGLRFPPITGARAEAPTHSEHGSNLSSAEDQ